MKRIAIVLLLLTYQYGYSQIITDTVQINRTSLLRSYGGSGDGINYPRHGYIAAQASTNNGNVTIQRSLFDCDWSAIPDSSYILEALLYLHPDPIPNNVYAGHIWTGGSNACLLSRVIEPWNENSVTWNSAPSTGAGNAVIISESSDSYQSYTLDISAMVQDIINDKSGHHGFHLKLLSESIYKTMVFASSFHGNKPVNPTLIVNYQLKNNVSIREVEFNSFKVFPNPAKSHLNIKSLDNETYRWSLIDPIGRIADMGSSQDISNRISLTNLNAGIYHLKIETRKGITTEKVVIQ